MTDTPCAAEQPKTPFVTALLETAKKEGIPLSGTFELTPRCNFNCRMCYVHLQEDRIAKFGSELSPQEWIRLAEEARDAGMMHICITGGEPLLYPGFEQFYRAVAQMGFEITLQTNASALTPRILKLLDEIPPNQVKITLYGTNDEVYKSVCGVEQGFTRVDRGIRALQELEIPIILVTTLIRQNLQDLPNMGEYARKRGLFWIYSASVHPSIRGAETDPNAPLQETDYTDFREDVRRMKLLPPRKDDLKPCQCCRDYRTGFWISWNGKMRFCSFMTEPDIEVRNRPFLQSWQELLDYEEALQWPQECQTCEIRQWCRRCAGFLASRSGSATKVDPAWCEKLKTYFKKECD